MVEHKTILADILDLEKDIKRCVKDVAQETFREVIHSSPTPVDSAGYSWGSFVLSNNITLSGGADTSFVTLTSEDIGAANKALAKARSIKILDIQIGSDVTISNSSPYNDFVEYTGWRASERGPKGHYHGTPPYAPFRKAFIHGEMYANSRVKQV